MEKNYNYIEKVVFLNSATMNEEIINVDGNVFLNGDNNAGKSTILRGFTYLSGNSPKNMNYQNGENFLKYYFKEGGSYMIQQYRKVDGMTCCLILYNGGGIFVIGDYDAIRGYIIDEKGFVSAKKDIVEKFKKANLTFYDTTPEKWRNIYYGNSMKITEGNPFVFCDYGVDIIPRLINTLHSKEIVGKDICYLLAKAGTEHKWNFRQFRENTNDLSNLIKDIIVNWGTPENPLKVQRAMKNVADKYDIAKAYKEDLTRLLGEMAYKYDESEERTKKLKQEIDILVESKNKKEKEKENELEGLDSKVDELKNKINKFEEFQHEYNKLNRVFSTDEMMVSISKYTNRQYLRNQYMNFSIQKERIMASSNIRKDELQNSYVSRKQNIEIELSRLDNTKKGELNDVALDIIDKVAKETERFKREFALLNEERAAITNKENLIKVISFMPNKWEHKDIESILGENNKSIVSSIREAYKEIKVTEKRIKEIKDARNGKREERDDLLPTIEKIEKELESKNRKLKNSIEKVSNTIIQECPDSMKDAFISYVKKLLGKIVSVVDENFNSEIRNKKADAEKKAKLLNEEIKRLDLEEIKLISVYKKAKNEYDDLIIELDNILSSLKKECENASIDMDKKICVLNNETHNSDYWDKIRASREEEINNKYNPTIESLRKEKEEIVVKIDNFEKEYEECLKKDLGEIKSRELDRLNADIKKLEADIDIANKFETEFGHKYNVYILGKERFAGSEKSYITNKREKEALEKKIKDVDNKYNIDIKAIEKKEKETEGIKTCLERTISNIDTLIRAEHILFDDRIATEERLDEILKKWEDKATMKKNAIDDLRDSIFESEGLNDALESYKSYNLPEIVEKNDENLLLNFGLCVKNQLALHPKLSQAVYVRIDSLQTELMNACRQFNEDADLITSQVKRINNEFDECVKNVPAIDYLQISINKDTEANGFISNLFDFYNFAEKYRIGENGERTFTTPDDYDKMEYYNKFINLITEASKDVYDNDNLIEISDIIKVRFRCSQNNQDSGWMDSIKAAGSEGTGILAKLFLDIALIEMAKKKSKVHAKLNIAIDEILKLSSDNFNEIVKYANGTGLNVICGAPSVTDMSEFDYIYQVWKEDANGGEKQTMTQLVSEIYKGEDYENESDEQKEVLRYA